MFAMAGEVRCIARMNRTDSTLRSPELMWPLVAMTRLCPSDMCSHKHMPAVVTTLRVTWRMKRMQTMMRIMRGSLLGCMIWIISKLVWKFQWDEWDVKYLFSENTAWRFVRFFICFISISLSETLSILYGVI